jgi:hypothetical protein
MIKATVKRTFRKVGLQISRVPRENAGYVAQPVSDQPEWINDIIQRVRPFTMTSGGRIAALCQAYCICRKEQHHRRYCRMRCLARGQHDGGCSNFTSFAENESILSI